MAVEALQQQLEVLRDEPVVYLGKVPHIIGGGAVHEEKRPRLEEVHRACRGMWRLPEERMQARLQPLLGKGPANDALRRS